MTEDKCENIRDFWDECHKNEVIVSLSGCGYDETIDWLRVRDVIKPGINALEIGVGMCHVTRGLRDAGTNVSCLEISPVGIERAMPFCDAIYTPDSLEKMPRDHFDLIICHNVVQHVPTDVLELEIAACINALVPGGKFAIEFVSMDGTDDNGKNPSIDDMKGGMLCRSIDFMRSLVEKYGGTCAVILDEKIKIAIFTGVHIIHVTK